MVNIDSILQNLQFPADRSFFSCFCEVRRQFYAILDAELTEQMWQLWLTDLELLRPAVSNKGKPVFLLTKYAVDAGYARLEKHTEPDGRIRKTQVLTQKGQACLWEQLPVLAEMALRKAKDRADDRPALPETQLAYLRRRLHYCRDLTTWGCWYKLNRLLQETLGTELPKQVWFDWLYDMGLLNRGHPEQAKRRVVTFANGWAMNRGYLKLVPQQEKPAHLMRPRMQHVLTRDGQAYVADHLDRLLERVLQQPKKIEAERA